MPSTQCVDTTVMVEQSFEPGLGDQACLHDPEHEEEAGLILDAVESRVAAALVRAPGEG